MENMVPLMGLNNREFIPQIGLGTWKNSRVPGDTFQAVKDAIDVGYRHFDGAFIYMNEKEVGQAIRLKMQEGVVQRNDVFVTSKVAYIQCPLLNPYSKPNLVEGCARKSLKDLGLDYIDLYLLHWPFAWKAENGMVVDLNIDLMDIWKAMECLVENGLVKSIGISNCNTEQLKHLVVNAKTPPAVVQVECHPYLIQSELVDYCHSQGIAFTAYSPFGSPTRSWAEADESKLLDDPLLTYIGSRCSKTAAQVILRWLYQRNLVAIPKTIRKDKMIENLNIFDFELSLKEVELINGLHRNWAACSLDACKNQLGSVFGTTDQASKTESTVSASGLKMHIQASTEFVDWLFNAVDSQAQKD